MFNCVIKARDDSETSWAFPRFAIRYRSINRDGVCISLILRSPILASCDTQTIPASPLATARGAILCVAPTGGKCRVANGAGALDLQLWLAPWRGRILADFVEPGGEADLFDALSVGEIETGDVNADQGEVVFAASDIHESVRWLSAIGGPPESAGITGAVWGINP